jgi:hypothetical protein
MGAIRGMIQGGKVVFDTPPDWPEGTPVEVEPVRAEESIGINEEERGPRPVVPFRMMTEEEQADDPESIAHWLAAFDAIPVAASSPFDDPAVIAWRDTMRKHNIEAMRKQMQETPE